MRWVPCELHAHTVHSDGRLTVEEMAREARRLRLEVTALTDHNTNSGLREIAQAEKAAGVTIIPGMELTTFHGHLLALGTTTYVEWRTLTRAGIQSAIDAIHEGGGLAGVAHPFHPGNPFCTGCHWDFEGPDWSRVDYLEVWSEADPWKKPKNHRALQLWNTVLDAGHRVAGVSSRDFHVPDEECLPAVTCAGIDERGTGLVAAVKAALRAGRVFVTLGPRLEIAVRASSSRRSHGPGDTLTRAEGGSLEIRVTWSSDDRRDLWERFIQPLDVEIQGNQGTLAGGRAQSAQGELSFSVPRDGHRWLRAELHGRARGEQAMIAFTNPVYLE